MIAGASVPLVVLLPDFWLADRAEHAVSVKAKKTVKIRAATFGVDKVTFAVLNDAKKPAFVIAYLSMRPKFL